MHDKLIGLMNKYRALRSERDAGRISDDEYKRQLETSAVADPRDEGCWWNISPESGLWIYFDGKEWAQRAPEGFDPMVSTSAPVTASHPAGKGGGAAWIWLIVVLVVVAALAAGSVAIVFNLTRGGAPSGDAAEKVEDALIDFYKAADDADYGDLKDLLTGRLADDIREREDDGDLREYLSTYNGARAGIEDVEIDGDEAEARVVLEKGNQRFEQDVDLELVDGNWKVAKLGSPELLAQGDRSREREREPLDPIGGGGDTEQQIRDLLNDFLTAFRSYDLDRMRGMLAGQALTEMAELEAVRNDPEQFEAVKEYMQQLNWEIRNLKIEGSGNRATAMIYLSLTEEPQSVTLERTGNQWKITRIEEEASDEDDDYYY